MGNRAHRKKDLKKTKFKKPWLVHWEIMKGPWAIEIDLNQQYPADYWTRSSEPYPYPGYMSGWPTWRGPRSKSASSNFR